MKLKIIIFIILFIILNYYIININGAFDFKSKKNVVGYYSNNLKNKTLKYHSLGEFCQQGSYDSIVIGSLYWNQNMTQFYFECQDYYSLIQDKEKELGIASTATPAQHIKAFDFSKRGVQNAMKEQNADDEEEEDQKLDTLATKLSKTIKKSTIGIEKNTYLSNKCVDLRNDIIKCQKLGVKILIQVGSKGGVGEFSNTTIATKEMAQKLAVKIWDMFLFGDGGRKEYQDKLKGIDTKPKQDESSEDIASFGSIESMDQSREIEEIDRFSSEAKKDDSSSNSTASLGELDDYQDEESYQEEYSNDEDTDPPIPDDEDSDYVDEEHYGSEEEEEDEDAVDEDGNPIVKKKKPLPTSKTPERKKKLQVFPPRPFGYGVFLDGVDFSPMIGKSDNYYHLAMGLDRYRVPKKDLFIISSTVDCSLLHSKKESMTSSSTALLRFNFDILTLDFVHNKQCDYWSKVSDQWIIDWANYTKDYKFNQTKLLLMASSNPKDSAFFSPKFFLMEYTKYCIDLPNMAGVYISDILSASKIYNTSTRLDFSQEISKDVKGFDPSTYQKPQGTRPAWTYGSGGSKPPTSPATKPIQTRPPITKGPVITMSPINNKTSSATTKTTTKPSLTKIPIIDSNSTTVKKVNSSHSTPTPSIKLRPTHAPLKTQSPEPTTESPTPTITPTPSPSSTTKLRTTHAPLKTQSPEPTTESPKPTPKPIPNTKKPIPTKAPITKAPITKAPITKAPIPVTESPTPEVESPVKLRPTHRPLKTQPPETESPVVTKAPPKQTKAPVTVPPKKETTSPINQRPTHKPLTQAPIDESETNVSDISDEAETRVLDIPDESAETRVITISDDSETNTVEIPDDTKPDIELPVTPVESSAPVQPAEETPIESAIPIESIAPVQPDEGTVEESRNRRHKPISATEFDKKFINK
ncbi:hypothetical protein RB653_004786 [Dictyostelium firmibasis]|uniref:GH18 domain-containing protein n=1 Tax=Dictyostelium firmibasis TaxID=79012 RepID=A0AAN7U8C2_9MYCE